MTERLPPWRPLLKGARQREGRGSSARWLQLASVAADGTPRIRTLVFRRWINGDQLDLFSDQRSDKIDELNHQRHVELCWLLPKARQQFRLRGSISSFTTTTEPELCRTAWLSLTPQGRAVWSWPHPGQPFQADADFPEDVDDSMPMPDHFIVLRLKLDQVEQLDLKPHPHRRVRWCAADNWSEQRLNP